MNEIGLTRGGFYKHFKTKDALVAAAVEAAFSEHLQRLASMSDQNSDDPVQTRRAFLDFCLSTAHRDDPANGCPSALASAMAQADPDGTPRAAYIEGERVMLAELAERTGGDSNDAEAQRERVLADLSTLVGAVLLARATAGDPISEDILTAARHRLERHDLTPADGL